MADDQLLERLTQDLRPVRRRRPLSCGLAVAALCALEALLLLWFGLARPTMPVRAEMPSFVWKLFSLGVIAVAGTATAILSFNPARSPRRGLGCVLALVLACLLSGWAIDVARDGLGNLAARLDWRDGIGCVTKMMALSLPPLLGLGLMMRSGAATEPGGTALAVGVAASAWGAFVFAFACPYDDPFYIVVWYVVGCGLVTLAARLLLPPLTRW